MAVVSANTSNINEDQGQYGAALDLLDNALALAREMEDQRLISLLQAYVGSTRLRLGDFQGAASALDEAVSVAREIQSPSSLAEALIYRGEQLLLTAQDREALKVMDEAVVMADKAEEHRLVLLARLVKGEARASREELQAVLREADTAGLRPFATRAQLALGRVLLEDKRPGDALVYAEKAIKGATGLGQKDLLAQAHHLAARALEARGGGGDTEKAVVHYESAVKALGDVASPLPEELRLFLESRPATTRLLGDAEPLLKKTGRSDSLTLLQSLR